LTATFLLGLTQKGKCAGERLAFWKIFFSEKEKVWGKILNDFLSVLSGRIFFISIKRVNDNQSNKVTKVYNFI
jgi:hypothetical protein